MEKQKAQTEFYFWLLKKIKEITRYLPLIIQDASLKLKKALSDMDKLLGDRPVYIEEETPD